MTTSGKSILAAAAIVLLAGPGLDTTAASARNAGRSLTNRAIPNVNTNITGGQRLSPNASKLKIRCARRPYRGANGDRGWENVCF